MSQSLFQQIYSIVCQIPPGQAATYGQIALLLGNPRMSRVVGTALSVCRDDAVPHFLPSAGKRTGCFWSWRGCLLRPTARSI